MLGGALAGAAVASGAGCGGDTGTISLRLANAPGGTVLTDIVTARLTLSVPRREVIATRATDADLAEARTIFDAVGITVTLDETHLDAVTGLSGSGPAYIFLILEALADAGVKVGLSRRDAQRLAAQTVMGSAKMLLDTDEHPGKLKDMVTSPGGTAIAGLHTLEEGGLRTTLINAVETATQRARELGRGGGK